MCFRLYENFEICPGKSVSVSDVQACFVEAFPGDKENGLLNKEELGRLFKKVFPNSVKSKRSGDGGRLHIYTNVCLKPPPVAGHQPILTWDFEFVFATKTSKSQIWICLDKDFCNGKRVVRELRIYSDFQYDLVINGQQVSHLEIPLEDVCNKVNLFERLFYFGSNVSICHGFSAESLRDSRNKDGEVSGSSERWSINTQISS